MKSIPFYLFMCFIVAGTAYCTFWKDVSATWWIMAVFLIILALAFEKNKVQK